MNWNSTIFFKCRFSYNTTSKLFSFGIQGLTSKWMKKRYFCIIKSSTLYFSHASYSFMFSRVLIQVFFFFFFRGLAFTLRHCETIYLSFVLLLRVFRLSDRAMHSIEKIEYLINFLYSIFCNYLESVDYNTIFSNR
jgi:hypothetical protein